MPETSSLGFYRGVSDGQHVVSKLPTNVTWVTTDDRSAMSEDSNGDETVEGDQNQHTLNRRNFVQNIGAAGSATALGALGSGSAVAREDDSPSVKKDDGLSAAIDLARARRSDRYQQMLEYLRSEGLALDEENIEVYATADANHPGTHRVCSFPMKSTTTEEYLRAGIAVKIVKGDIRGVTGSKTRRLDKDTVEANRFDIVDGEVQSEVVRVNRRSMSVERHTKNGGTTSISGIQASNQSIGCDACYWAGDLICAVGCGAPLGVICYLLTSTLVLGVACGSFVTVFCSALIFVKEHTQGYACDSDYVLERVCSRIDAC